MGGGRVMDISLWIGRVQKIEKRIRQLKDARENARQFLYVSSAFPKGERVQVSRKNYAEEHMVKYLAYDEKLRVEIARLYQVKAEIIDAISKVGDDMLCAVLTGYYINGKQFSQIAEELGYSNRQITRLHQKALQILKDVLECHLVL